MEVEGLRTAHVIKALDVTPPQTVMSRETYEEYLCLPVLQEADDVPYMSSKPGAYSDDHAWFSPRLEFVSLLPNSVCETETFPKDGECLFTTVWETKADFFLLDQITASSCSTVPAPGMLQRAFPARLQTFPHPSSILCAKSTTSVDATPRASTTPRATLALALTPSLYTVQTSSTFSTAH